MSQRSLVMAHLNTMTAHTRPGGNKQPPAQIRHASGAPANRLTITGRWRCELRLKAKGRMSQHPPTDAEVEALIAAGYCEIKPACSRRGCSFPEWLADVGRLTRKQMG